MYALPDFTGAFITLALPTLIVYGVQGVRWIVRGKAVRVWRALLVVLFFPVTLVAHVLVTVYAFGLDRMAALVCVVGIPFAVGKFGQWLLRRPLEISPRAKSIRQMAGIAGFAVLAALLSWHWYGPVPERSAPVAERLMRRWDFSDAKVSVDGQRVFILERSGWLLRSDDGGVHWQWQELAKRGRYASLHVSDDGRFAWAVGADGVIVHSADAGETWIEQASDAPPEPFVALSFAEDNRTGWIAGQRGALLQTADGGMHWTPSAKPAEPWSLVALSFSNDGRVGAVLSAGGRELLTTRDGGKTWRRLWVKEMSVAYDRVDVSGDGARIVVPPRSYGHGHFPLSPAYESFDEGLTWTAVQYDALTKRRSFFTTADGGVTWKDEGAAFVQPPRRDSWKPTWFIDNRERFYVSRTDASAWEMLAWKPAVRFGGAEPTALAFAGPGGSAWIAGGLGTIAMRANDREPWRTVVPDALFPAAAAPAPDRAPIPATVEWSELPAVPPRLEPMTPQEVESARAGAKQHCRAWVFLERDGRRQPVAMIVNSNDRAFPFMSVAKLDGHLRLAAATGVERRGEWLNVTTESDDIRDPRATAFAVHDFTPLVEGEVRAAPRDAGVALAFISEDVRTVTRRHFCSLEKALCRRYEGPFTATWVRASVYTENDSPVIADPRPVTLSIEDPCPFEQGGFVEPRYWRPGLYTSLARLWRLGPTVSIP